MMQRGLEEGVREFAGVQAATVSAMSGDRLGPFSTDRMGDERSMADIRKLHAARKATAQTIDPVRVKG